MNLSFLSAILLEEASQVTDRFKTGNMTSRYTVKRVSIISISEKMRVPSTKPKDWYGCRHTQVILMSLSILCCYGIRVIPSVSLEAMTHAASANPDFQEFDWDNSVKDVILSSFFWGYVCTQIPGSVAAHRWGAQKFLTSCLLISGLVTLAIPFAATYSGWEAVCAIRVITGLVQGVLLPTLHTLLSKWAPTQERGSLSTYVYSGGWIGNVLCLFSSGALSASRLGWPSCFYFWGLITVLCAVACFFFLKESPAEHPNIPADEKEYIQVSLGVTETKEHLPTPWYAIARSIPAWALLLSQMAQNWGFWMLITKTPSYAASVLEFDIANNGLYSALPYLTAWIISFPISYASDVLIKKNCVSLTFSRKVWNTLGQWLPAAALMALGYVSKDQPMVAIGLLIFSVATNVVVYCGHAINHMDLSPNFAGTLMGITNSISNICGILAPLVCTAVIRDASDVSQWRIVFFLSAVIYIIGNLAFILYGTAEVQAWNDPVKKNGAVTFQVPEKVAEEGATTVEKNGERMDTEKKL